jgi:cytochrome c556
MIMSTKRAFLVAAAAALLTMPTMAAAPGTIKARQDNFKAMGRSMKMIGDELKKDAPAFAVIRREAAALEKAGARIGKYFPKGSGPEAGVKTEALPAIWQKPADFRAATANLNHATKGLRTAAAGTDASKVRTAVGATFGTCKACHEKFRLDD